MHNPIRYCRRQAHFCVLADNCNEGQYVKLVEALCVEHGINLIKVCLDALLTIGSAMAEMQGFVLQAAVLPFFMAGHVLKF